jgi:hypothetical protein
MAVFHASNFKRSASAANRSLLSVEDCHTRSDISAE